uniref:Uncharacterized protein n=1 Tax=Tetranychus urticae TaxID=32264 RepID=T1KJD8_TETUR
MYFTILLLTISVNKYVCTQLAPDNQIREKPGNGVTNKLTEDAPVTEDIFAFSRQMARFIGIEIVSPTTPMTTSTTVEPNTPMYDRLQFNTNDTDMDSPDPSGQQVNDLSLKSYSKIFLKFLINNHA